MQQERSEYRYRAADALIFKNKVVLKPAAQAAVEGSGDASYPSCSFWLKHV